MCLRRRERNTPGNDCFSSGSALIGFLCHKHLPPIVNLSMRDPPLLARFRHLMYKAERHGAGTSVELKLEESKGYTIKSWIFERILVCFKSTPLPEHLQNLLQRICAGALNFTLKFFKPVSFEGFSLYIPILAISNDRFILSLKTFNFSSNHDWDTNGEYYFELTIFTYKIYEITESPWNSLVICHSCYFDVRFT